MFGKRAKGDVVLIADVDDMSAGVAVVDMSTTPAVVLAGERATLLIEERSAQQSASGVLQLLEQCADKVLKGYLNANTGSKVPQAAPPESIFIVLRPPWTRFRTARADEAFPEPKTVTKALVEELARKAIATITDLDAGNILETGVMQVFLNGYPTGDPIGKHARTVFVTAFESDVNADMKRGALEIFGKLLPGRTPSVRSGLRTLLTVAHEHIPDVHRYCLLDMAGSMTSCTVVHNEAVTQSTEVREGSASIIRRIAGSGVPEEALAQLRMLVNDTCSTEACKAMKDTLARTEPALVKVYGDMFGAIAEKRRLPNKALLVAPVELALWLEAFFARLDFGQFTATTQPFEVETLTPEHLQSSVLWKAGAPDTQLAIDATCVHILGQTAGKRL